LEGDGRGHVARLERAGVALAEGVGAGARGGQGSGAPGEARAVELGPALAVGAGEELGDARARGLAGLVEHGQLAVVLQAEVAGGEDDDVLQVAGQHAGGERGLAHAVVQLVAAQPGLEGRLLGRQALGGGRALGFHLGLEPGGLVPGRGRVAREVFCLAFEARGLLGIEAGQALLQLGKLAVVTGPGAGQALAHDALELVLAEGPPGLGRALALGGVGGGGIACHDTLLVCLPHKWAWSFAIGPPDRAWPGF